MNVSSNFSPIDSTSLRVRSISTQSSPGVLTVIVADPSLILVNETVASRSVAKLKDVFTRCSCLPYPTPAGPGSCLSPCSRARRLATHSTVLGAQGTTQALRPGRERTACPFPYEARSTGCRDDPCRHSGMTTHHRPTPGTRREAPSAVRRLIRRSRPAWHRRTSRWRRWHQPRHHRRPTRQALNTASTASGVSCIWGSCPGYLRLLIWPWGPSPISNQSPGYPVVGSFQSLGIVDGGVCLPGRVRDIPTPFSVAAHPNDLVLRSEPLADCQYLCHLWLLSDESVIEPDSRNTGKFSHANSPIVLTLPRRRRELLRGRSRNTRGTC